MPRKIDRFELPAHLHPLLDACGWSRLAATEAGRSTWVPNRGGGLNQRPDLPCVERRRGHQEAIAAIIPVAAARAANAALDEAAEEDVEAERLEVEARNTRAKAAAARARAAAIEAALADLRAAVECPVPSERTPPRSDS